MTGGLRAGIQADDLTGACDTGAVFAARGLETVVLLPDAPVPSPVPKILVLDTESRGLPPTEARARARQAFAELAAQRPAVLYKKVDSTLRGALAAELAGALEGAGRPHAVLAPAFPGQRRIVADGVLHVDGRPACESPVARDPAFPSTGASVLALVGVDGPHPVGHIPLAAVRRGPAGLAARLERWTAMGGGTLVCDAETEADLRVLAAAAVGGSALLAGSAGLAAAVAARMGSGGAAGPNVRPRRPLYVVAGSADPTTQGQVARLEARGVPGIWLSSDRLSRVGEVQEEEWSGFPLLCQDRFLAARVEPASADPPRREAMARRLAEGARRWLEAARPGAVPGGSVLVTGGDTAVALCRALGASGLRLVGEVERGLALGALLDGPFAGLALITKAGGFGDPETLVRVWEAST